MKRYSCRFVLGYPKLGLVLMVVVELPEETKPSKTALALAARTQLRDEWQDCHQLHLTVSSGGRLSNLTVVMPFASLSETNLTEWHLMK